MDLEICERRLADIRAQRRALDHEAEKLVARIPELLGARNAAAAAHAPKRRPQIAQDRHSPSAEG